MTTTPDLEQTPALPSCSARLFHFTDEEEKAIRQAIRQSIKFMDSFGRGQARPPIDLSHYYNDNNQ